MIGLPLGVVALIIVGGITALLVFLGNTLGPVQEAASSYAQALKDQRYEAAYAMRCPGGAAGQDAFVGYWKAESAAGRGITGFNIVGVNVETTNGRTSGEVDLEIRFANGKTDDQALTLTKTGETWQPCG